MTLRRPGAVTIALLAVTFALASTGDDSVSRTRPDSLTPQQWELYNRLQTSVSGTLPGTFCWSEDTPPQVMEAFASVLPQSPAFDFDDNNRWYETATDGPGLGQGDPTTLTWGILPDSVDINISGDVAPSRLIHSLDILYGSGPGGSDLTQRPWFTLFQQVFDRWSSLIGVRYVYEPADDRASFPDSHGSLGVRPDIRIGGRSIDGTGQGILGFNLFPANGGDMVLDTDNSNFLSETANNSRGLRNLVAHEHGHGLGLFHSCPVEATKLMEPLISLEFDGPQHDDILGANRAYGDTYEFPVENDDVANATDLGFLAPGTSVKMTNLSMDNSTDVFDTFAFSVGDMIRISFTVAPVGTVYFAGKEEGNNCPLGSFFNSKIQDNLGVRLLDQAGTGTLAESAYQPAGFDESVTDFLLTQGAGTYFVQVFADTNKVQLYDLEISASAGQAPVALCKDVKSCRADVNILRLDAGSYDPDGDDITYSVEPPGPYPPGMTEVLFIVEDGILADTCAAVVTVNRPPAAAARNLVVSGTGSSCSVGVPPDSVDNGSSDPDGDALTLALEPSGPFAEGDTEVLLIATDPCGEADTAAAVVTVDCTVPVRLLSFTAVRRTRAVDLDWEVADARDHAGFHVYRQTAGGERERLTSTLLSGRTVYTFTDEDPPGSPVEYWLGELSRTGDLTWYGPAVPEDAPVLVARVGLAHPNPFAASTSLRFTLPRAEEVEAVVYDIRGRVVRTLMREQRGPGEIQTAWDGRDQRGRSVPAGLYFLRLAVGREASVQKIVYAP